MTSPTPVLLHRNLGGTTGARDDASTATLLPQASDNTSSSLNLFPTTTAASNSGGSAGGPSANVYYLVFLGLLVLLLLVAACLAFRTFRMRRRYRTATQRALARGEPLPPNMRNDYWGLAGLAGWTPEGLARTAAAREEELHRSEPAARPVIYDSELREVQDNTHEMKPLMLQSLRTEYVIENPSTLVPDPGPTARSFNPPRFVNLRNRRTTSQPDAPYTLPNTGEASQQEADRVIEHGEDLRMAIIIRMPSAPGQTDIDRPEEEITAWEQGMEVGVWEGQAE